MTSPETRIRVRFRTIVAAVAAEYGIKADEITSPLVIRRVTFARHVAMWLAARRARILVTRIGEMCSGRHFVTVNHAVENIDTYLERTPGLVSRVDRIWADAVKREQRFLSSRDVILRFDREGKFIGVEGSGNEDRTYGKTMGTLEKAPA